ncbi:MAG: hypothetical protein Kow0063_11790 [Anaerolineae bacterium]
MRNVSLSEVIAANLDDREKRRPLTLADIQGRLGQLVQTYSGISIDNGGLERFR